MSPAIHVLFLFISFCWEIIEPEAEVMDIVKVSARAMYLYSQPTQTRNPIRRGPPLSYHSVFNYEKDSCSQRPRLFQSSHIYTCLKPLP